MAHLVNKDFIELAADGSNYVTRAMDVKISISAKTFVNAINEPNPKAHHRSSLQPSISFKAPCSF